MAGQAAACVGRCAARLEGTFVDARSDIASWGGLALTIIRPGGLRTQPSTGQGVLSCDPEMHGFIGRADVALLIERALRDGPTTSRAFAAVDVQEARWIRPLRPFPLAA